MTRVVLVAGKGGVGKSTTAAATAALAARRGRRAVVVSVDSAPSLGEVFGRPIGGEVVEVAPRLAALEVDVNREIRSNWSAVVDFFRTLSANSPQVNTIVAEECAVLPGMEEVFGLLRLDDLIVSERFDLIVVDAPPTGDALKFLRLPEVLEWYFTKFYPVERRILRSLRPLAGQIGAAIPDDAMLAEIAGSHERVGRLAAILQQPGRTSVRLVLNPDLLGLAETRRALTMISLFGLMVDAVVVNKIVPASTDPFLAGWGAEQRKVLATIEDDFAGWPILQSRLRPAEIIGADPLADFGEEVYGPLDPAAPILDRSPIELADEDGVPTLRLRLPFLAHVKPELWLRGGSLVLAAAGQRRHLPLPPALAGRRLLGASYQGDALAVRFSPPPEEPAAPTER